MKTENEGSCILNIAGLIWSMAAIAIGNAKALIKISRLQKCFQNRLLYSVRAAFGNISDHGINSILVPKAICCCFVLICGNNRNWKEAFATYSFTPRGGAVFRRRYCYLIQKGKWLVINNQLVNMNETESRGDLLGNGMNFCRNKSGPTTQ